ncbi:MAG TPA: dihydrofolate reductase, partial [Rhodanobacteraceae bacterium]|nr:dihydrofolate reductase [Rhodanobacteraceae bacterium]
IGRALPGRPNWVLSRGRGAPFAGQRVVHSLAQAVEQAGAAELMVIGGGEIYALALPQAQRLHLTLVDARIDGADTWFPAFDPAVWRETFRQHHPADAQHAFGFDFVDCERMP